MIAAISNAELGLPRRSEAKPGTRTSDLPSSAGWLSVAAAAAILGCSDRHIARLCRSGELAARQDEDGRWFIDPDGRAEFRAARGDFGPPRRPELVAPSLADLTDAKRESLYARHEAVAEYLAAESTRPADMGLCTFMAAWVAHWNAIRQARGPEPGTRGPALTVRTLRRRLAAYRAAGIAGLIDQRRRALSTETSEEALDCAAGLWLQQERPTLQTVYRQVLALAPSAGWTVPSYRHFVRLMRRRLDPKVCALGRDPRRYRDRCELLLERDWSRVAAMELWVADHRQLDLWVPKRGDGGRWGWARPYLTAFVDARSWMPVGWTLAWDAPNSDRVMGTFARAVREHGLPAWVYLDNGKDFRAAAFAGKRVQGPKSKVQGLKSRPKDAASPVDQPMVEPILRVLGVEVVWALPYNARAKVIEPWFRLAIAEHFDKCWPTYCGQQTVRGQGSVDRPERLKGLDPETEAAKGLSLETVRQSLESYLSADWSLRACPVATAESEGLSVLRAFRHLRSADFAPTRPADETLAMLLLPSRPISVAQSGLFVKEFNQSYWAAELEDRRAASGEDQGRKVLVRFDPGDPSRVFVFGPQGEFLAVATPYVGCGVHPLSRAGDEADRDQLSAALELRSGLSKGVREQVRFYRDAAGLARNLEAAERLGLRDDPSSIPPADPPVIRLVGGADRAAKAGRADKRRKLAQPKFTAAAVGLAAAMQPKDESGARAAPSALELLARKESMRHGN